ncbi:MAG: hypothetical protein AB2L14_25975 [Candidatus Xenobiia bacterium LiM19]
MLSKFPAIFDSENFERYYILTGKTNTLPEKGWILTVMGFQAPFEGKWCELFS